jgi:hypothetical protein
MTPKKPMVKSTKKVMPAKSMKTGSKKAMPTTSAKKMSSKYGTEGTGTPPKGTPVYSRPAPTRSYQDSMNAYNKIKGKAAGAENLKPKGAPKTFVKMKK